MSVSSKHTKKAKNVRENCNSLCQICEDAAIDHLHFGGATCCFPCKAFFRRVVRHEMGPLICLNDGKCEITIETRRKCQACRFAKCIKSGMDPKWVMKREDIEERDKVKWMKKNAIGSEGQNIGKLTQFQIKMRNQRQRQKPSQRKSSKGQNKDQPNTVVTETVKNDDIEDIFNELPDLFEMVPDQLNLTSDDVQALFQSPQIMSLFTPPSIHRPLEPVMTAEETFFLQTFNQTFMNVKLNLSVRETMILQRCLFTKERFAEDVLVGCYWKTKASICTFLDSFVPQLSDLEVHDKELLFTSNIPIYQHLLTLAFSFTPPALDSEILKEIITESNKGPYPMTKARLGLFQAQPPSSWYQNDQHEQEYLNAIKFAIGIGMTRTTLHLMYMICLFQRPILMDLNRPDQVSEIESFYKGLLYRHLRTKIGHVFANETFEKYQQAIKMMTKIPPLNPPEQ